MLCPGGYLNLLKTIIFSSNLLRIVYLQSFKSRLYKGYVTLNHKGWHICNANHMELYATFPFAFDVGNGQDLNAFNEPISFLSVNSGTIKCGRIPSLSPENAENVEILVSSVKTI